MSLKEKVIEYIQTHEGADTAEIHQALGCDLIELVRILKELQDEGIIEEVIE